MISGMKPLRPLGMIIGFGVAIGCNVILGNEEPVMRHGSGGSGSSSSNSSSGQSSGGAGGGCNNSPSTAMKGCGGGSAWAHWNPEKQKEFATTDNTAVDSLTGLMWQRHASSNQRTWQQATDDCEALVLDGYCDWRLPSRIELLSIVKFTTSSPTLDASVFPNTPADGFWTSSTFVGTNAAKTVYFDDGRVGVEDASFARYVRCVR